MSNHRLLDELVSSVFSIETGLSGSAAAALYLGALRHAAWRKQVLAEINQAFADPDFSWQDFLLGHELYDARDEDDARTCAHGMLIAPLAGAMEFRDVFVSREERFSIGQELFSERYYLSFPVRNPFVDYEEYYALTDAQFDLFQADPAAARAFLAACRERRHDELLIVAPGRLRGTAN